MVPPLNHSTIMTSHNSPSGSLLGRRTRAVQRLNWTSSATDSLSSSPSPSFNRNTATTGSSAVVPPARRALFVDKNNINPEQNLKMVKMQLAEFIENDCKKWNFDFVKGCPWPNDGNSDNSMRFEWESVVPSPTSSPIPTTPSSRVPKRLFPQSQLSLRQSAMEHHHHQKGSPTSDEQVEEWPNLISDRGGKPSSLPSLYGYLTRVRMDTDCSLSSDPNNKNDGNNEKSTQKSGTMKRKIVQVLTNHDLKASKLEVKPESKRQKTIPENFTMNEEERRLRAKGWNDPPTYTFDQINQANQGMNVKATLPMHKRYKYPAPTSQGAGMPVGPGTAAVQQSYGPTGVASMSSSNPQAGPMDVGGAPLYSSVPPYGHPQAGYSNVPNVSQHGTAHSQYYNSGQAFPPEATMQPQQVTQQYQNYNTQQYQHYNTQQGNFQPHQ